MKTAEQRAASDLRAIAKSFRTVHADLGALELAAQEHAEKDAARFKQLGEGQASLEHRFEFLENRLEVLHDQLIEGFRKLGAQITKRDPNEVTPPRRGRNGR